MKLKFWNKGEPEKRNYTEAVLLRQIRGAEGDDGDADPNATAAAQIAASFLGRCLALAVVEPETIRRVLTPAVLYDIGADFIFGGEALYLIDVSPRGELRLIRASSWDITGDAMNWRYHATIPGPSGDEEIHVSQDAVFHPRINTSRREPHKGRSPVELAGFSASALANLERSFSDEASGPTGQVLPAPIGGLSENQIDNIRHDIGVLKGKTILVESMAAGFGDGRSNAPQGDWTSRRIGADPPQSMIQLREQTHDAVLASCGVSPVLFGKGTDASAAREALRQFLHSTLSPVAELIADEAREKLGDRNISFNFDRLFAADTQGRARAAKSLVDAGFTADEAAKMTGFSDD